VDPNNIHSWNNLASLYAKAFKQYDSGIDNHVNISWWFQLWHVLKERWPLIRTMWIHWITMLKCLCNLVLEKWIGFVFHTLTAVYLINNAQAHQLLQYAVQISPQSVRSLHNLASCYEQLGQPTEVFNSCVEYVLIFAGWTVVSFSIEDTARPCTIIASTGFLIV